MMSRAIQSPKQQLLPDKKLKKSKKTTSEEVVHVRQRPEIEYESRVRDLERKSIDAMRRLGTRILTSALRLVPPKLENVYFCHNRNELGKILFLIRGAHAQSRVGVEREAGE